MNEAVGVLQKTLENADIPDEIRGGLADDLELAASINGDPDQTRQMFKRLLVSGVRRELASYQRPEKALALHVAKYHDEPCGKTERVLRALRPFAWPLAVCAFSPFAPDIISKVIMVLKGA